MATIDQMRDLPAVATLLDEIAPARLPRAVVVELARSALEVARRSITAGSPADPVAIAQDLITAMALSRSRAVINATGVLLHTNLGRAPFSKRAVSAITSATGYTNLEIDLVEGRRGDRGSYLRHLISVLTGAEDAVVVNNNAGAVLLALAATSTGRAVPVARGELIEIGGAYRLPEVMQASGAELIEVGTTNRTRVGDYATALQLHNCGAVLKVHPSNYRIEGFSGEASIEELAVITRPAGIPLIFDIGSGHLDASGTWLVPADRAWLRDEPAAAQALVAGADLVTFSGDKIIGGPQAGIVAGTSELISQLRSHPLSRALRVDAITEAALTATLESFADGDVGDIPLWAMIREPEEQLLARAEHLQKEIGGIVEVGDSLIGAGSVPGSMIKSPQLVVDAPESAFRRLLGEETPIVARRREGRLVFDFRTVDVAHDSTLSALVQRCL